MTDWQVDKKGMKVGHESRVTSILTSRGVESFGDGNLNGLVVLFIAFKEF